MPLIPTEDGGLVLDETDWMEPYTFENEPRSKKDVKEGEEKGLGLDINLESKIA